MRNSMEENSEDILVDISNEELPKLAEIYEKHKELLPQAYSTILTVIEWKEKSDKNYLQVTSPNSCWREDGTFFVYLEDCGTSLVIFSLEKSGKNVYKALMETKRLSGLRLFYAIHETLYPPVKQFIDDKKLTAEDTHSYMFSISRHEALKYTIECPPDVYIKKIDVSYVPIILYPRKSQISEKYLTMMLEMNDSYGIFSKSNGELMSWMIPSIMGQLGTLKTKDEHRRKGYGSLITKYVCRELAKKGHNPFATVLVENYISMSLFKKLGFKCLGKSTFIDVE